MRTIAIAANLVLLALIGWMAARGEMEINAEEMPLFGAMILAPILSIVALLLRGVASKDWLSRYFERKSIEEQRKLASLRSQNGQPGTAVKGGPVTLSSSSLQ